MPCHCGVGAQLGDNPKVLLFGKKSFGATGAELLAAFLREVRAAPAPSGDLARQWLAAAGQIEQALADAGSPAAEAAAALSDAAAGLLLFPDGGPGASAAMLSQAAERVAARCDGRVLRVTVPEGFAWYALYPDAYAATAERWLAAQKGQVRRCCVIGLRSIGTALSAAVSAQLRLQRAAVQRVTLRPEGPPFARRVRLPPLQPADAYIVVDEGPGLSGSSMSGVADALKREGISPRRIVFFPGHDKGPGAEASEAVRRWWAPERVWTTDGMVRVREELGRAAEAWLGEAVTMSDAPQRVTLFEMPQMVARTASGAAARLWFGGFAAVDPTLTPRARRLAEVQQARAAAGSAPPLLGVHAGWIGIREPAGSSLSPEDQTPCVVRNHIAPALLQAARHETIADHAARMVEAIQAWREERAPEAPLTGLAAASRLAEGLEEQRVFGDGDLAPSAFLRCADGRVVKRTPGGHDCSHGWAGAQTILWDIAGASVEWRLQRDLSAALIHMAGADHVPPMVMSLHRAGYCCQHLAVALHHGCAEAAAGYEARLRDELALLAAEA